MAAKERKNIQDKARAARVHALRQQGVSVREVAELVGCQRDQVRKP